MRKTSKIDCGSKTVRYCRERKVDPAKCRKDSFATKTLSETKKVKGVFCKLKRSGKLVLQTLLHPKERGICRVSCTVKKPCETSRLLPGGRAASKCITDFDPAQLRKGTKVELEHTRNKKLAREIAMDHLVEHPSYYVELAKMERRLRNREKQNRRQ